MWFIDPEMYRNIQLLEIYRGLTVDLLVGIYFYS